MRGPRRWAGSAAAVMPKRRRLTNRSTYRAAAANMHQRTMLEAMAAPSAPSAGNPPWPKIRQPVQAHVHDVRHDDDHHPRDRTADAFEKEARRHVQQHPGKPVAERRQHPAASGRDVLGLSHREQERFAERACGRHHRTGDRRVCKAGAPDRAALFRSSGTDRLSHHHDGAHQQPDSHEHQRDLGCDGDPVPGEVLS